jgi:hypothetical protein
MFVKETKGFQRLKVTSCWLECISNTVERERERERESNILMFLSFKNIFEKNFYLFLCLNFFLMFSAHFHVLMSKIIFKK